MNKRRRNSLIFIAIALLVAVLGAAALRTGSATKAPEHSYDEVVQNVQRTPQAIKELTVMRLENVTVVYKDAKRAPLTAEYPDERSLNELVKTAISKHVKVQVAPAPTTPFWQSLLLNMIGPLLILGLMVWAITKTTNVSKMLGGGKRFEAQDADDMRVRFSDVAGIGEAKDETMEIVEFLRDPDKFHRLGARSPRGILFVGPPGTGKTLLAKAVAGESGAAFFSVSGSDFVEMFAGLGAKRVRELFANARQQTPAIIFIDEIDAVGKPRGSSVAGNDEREQTLNQILVEMDGFSDRDAVVVIAATNRPDNLDKALLRPGRFDRQISVDAPDLEGRRAILAIHAKGKPISEDTLATVAAQTPGFTGADLANLLNEAAIVAARRGESQISQSCIADAIDRVIAGSARRSLTITEHERQVIAYHEVGHALTAHFADHPTPVQRISAVSRGRALGYTFSVPDRDRVLETRASLMDRLTMLMGGRAAELEVFGVATSGCANDLERATAIATKMVTTLGMSNRIGLRYVAGNDESYTGAPTTPLQGSPELLAAIDSEVAEIIAEAQQRAVAAIRAHRTELERVTAVLRERETIHGDEFLALLADQPLAQVSVAPPAKTL